MVDTSLAGSDTWRTRTRLVRGGLERSQHMETAEAMYMTSGYVDGSAEEAEKAFSQPSQSRYVYSRFRNPTVAAFEERLRLIEGAEACRATSTGMAAVFASLMCQLRSGDRVVAARALFGSCLWICTDYLPRLGVEVEIVDGTELSQWRRALSKLAKQRPLDLGADIVVYSTTKHIDGQGRGLGGAILCTEKFLADQLGPFLRHTGPTMSPFNAWLMMKGLETLDLRLRAHCASARIVAEALARHAAVERVLYPGLLTHPQHRLAASQMSDFGTVVTFTIRGGKAGAFRALNALRIIDISNNLGDAKSLVCHPATTTHQRLSLEEKRQLGIEEGVVRLSVGLEDPDDLIEDLTRSLDAI
jgi:O-succinylhomoserine sulfhydrylase